MQAFKTPQLVPGQTIFEFKSTLASYLAGLSPEEFEELLALDTQFADVQKAFTASFNSYKTSATSEMYIKMPIPSGFFHANSPTNLEGVEEKPSLLLTFGSHDGQPHLEEQCSSGFAQLDFGTKE